LVGNITKKASNQDLSGNRFSESFGSITLSGRRVSHVSKSLGNDYPLIIAIHGGTYSSAYFDLPGFSLIDRATNFGIPIIAIDRPGYGNTTPFAPADATIAKNAECLDDAIGEIWGRYGGKARGIVLIGHSIGGAITVSIAARRPSWPLLGIAISGVGLVTPPESGEQWAALPNIPMIELPPDMKDQVMFGPDWTFRPDAPALSHAADAPVPRAELIDIVTTWPSTVQEIAAKVQVPVHYRQAEFDRLWITNTEQVQGFGAALLNSSKVDAAIFGCVGHCIDFHRLGGAFQLEQLAFALRCCVRHEG
jgi:pimeloyl-ACP methyl ester carboxylesterase